MAKAVVLVDSSVIISLFDSDDSNNELAKFALQRYGSTHQFQIVSHVIDEVSTILVKRKAKKSLTWFFTLIENGLFSVRFVDDALTEWQLTQAVFQTLSKQKNKASFTDVYQQVLAEKYRLKILTFDHHFRKELVLPLGES